MSDLSSIYKEIWNEEQQKNKKEWTLDEFLKSNYIDLNTVNPGTLAKIINFQPSLEKNKILSEPIIKKYFKNIILTEKISYDLYEEIFQNIDILDMIELLDYEFIDKFFAKKTGEEYKFLVCLFHSTKNPNKMLEIIIDKKYLYQQFKKEFTKFYSIVSYLDCEHIKLLIDEIIKNNDYEYFPTIAIPHQYEKQLIKEEYPVYGLIWLVEKMSIETISEFFQSDKRAELVLPYLKNNQINKYIGSGVQFGNQIIRNKNFFEILKCESIMTFRERINYIEDYCDNPNFIEEKRKAYYEEIINSYNKESGLFLIYDEILRHPNLPYDKIKGNKDPYIAPNGIIQICGNDKDKYLKETSMKLSEIIIDALFQDNIYNTWINIKELLRFENQLSKKEKTLSTEKISFYNFILDIDSYSNDKKIKLYHELKNKNIHLMFYEDLRKSKDLAYQKIKDNLINPTKHPELINKSETEKYQVDIYDLRNKEFYMLVRTLIGTYRQNGAKGAGSSYSLISNNNTDVFDLTYNRIIYGYNSFSIDKVLHMFEFDSFSSNHIDSIRTTKNITNRPNRISTKEEIANSPGYSEIVLKNNKIDNGFDEIKPDFIVVIEEINKLSLEISKTLNIPIVIIPKTQINKNVNYLTDHTEGYAQGSLYELERMHKR